MQSLNLAGSSNSSMSSSPSVNPTGSLSMQQQQLLFQQQQQALQNSETHSKLQDYLQQIVLCQLGSLTADAGNMSPQSLLTLMTNVDNLKELLGKVHNLQNSQNYRNFQGHPAITANAIGFSSLLELLDSSFLRGNGPSPLVALSALESSLESCWSTPLSARVVGTGAPLTWNGHLPPHTYENATYSCKVFVGGLPWDIKDFSLMNAFKQFGSLKLERSTNRAKGFAYIIFDNENNVKALLEACTFDSNNGGSWYYKMSSGYMRSKEVEIIPWIFSDKIYVCPPAQYLDPQKTVFIGALPGKLTAEELALIMDGLFGEVLNAVIHTDKFNYPMGSGRVTFSNNRSYMKAVAATVVEIKTPKFKHKSTREIQVKPFLQDSVCAICRVQEGPLFCRDLTCFKYFCRSCWQQQHNSDLKKHHHPLELPAGMPGESNSSSSPTTHNHQ